MKRYEQLRTKNFQKEDMVTVVLAKRHTHYERRKRNHAEMTFLLIQPAPSHAEIPSARAEILQPKVQNEQLKEILLPA